MSMEECKYKTLQEVYDAVKSGELDESKISIYMDNDCSSIMYGDIDLYESDAGYDAEELANFYGIAANVFFSVGMSLNTGTPPEEMVKFYNLADCYVSSTMGESFGLPALESMACGTPCIIPNHTT
ncbi:hypothetical protein LCGC14_2847420, partial [marine sediment metagenome]